MRQIHIVGDIDDTAFREFSEKLSAYEGKLCQSVHIILNSQGGSTYDGLAFYGRISASPCLITITAYGAVMSAATLILAAGHHRQMHKSAWFMVHDDTRETGEASADLMRVEAEHADAVETQWAQLLSACSDTPAAEWRRLSRKTTYLTPQQLLTYGLIDEIV